MIENIRFAFRGIKTHKMRSFLTMLGVIIGIASIIAIVSIVEGTKQQLTSSLVGAGNNTFSVTLSREGYEYNLTYEPIPFGIRPIRDETLSRIQDLEDVVACARYTKREDSNMIYYQTANSGYSCLYGVDLDYLNALEYEVVKGRTFSQNDFDQRSKVIILDNRMVEALFYGKDPIGQIVEVKGEPYQVIGVVENSNTKREYNSLNEYYMYYYANLSAAFIPSTTWPILYQFDEPENVAIRVNDADQMAKVGQQASEILNQSTLGGEVSYAYVNYGSDQEELELITTAIQLMLVGIASLSLIVGGIGVMNIMLVSVTERTPEIGLKKALGAKRKNILAQFLTESATLTGVGGVIGIGVGCGLAKIISLVANLKFVISIPWVIISLVFSILIGVVFGATPALKASKLSPIDALRRE